LDLTGTEYIRGPLVDLRKRSFWKRKSSVVPAIGIGFENTSPLLNPKSALQRLLVLSVKLLPPQLIRICSSTVAAVVVVVGKVVVVIVVVEVVVVVVVVLVLVVVVLVVVVVIVVIASSVDDTIKPFVVVVVAFVVVVVAVVGIKDSIISIALIAGCSDPPLRIRVMFTFLSQIVIKASLTTTAANPPFAYTSKLDKTVIPSIKTSKMRSPVASAHLQISAKYSLIK
jgi:hypothetical protein